MATGAAAQQPMSWGEFRRLDRVEPDHRIAYGTGPLAMGELYLPEGSGPHPVAVVIHGGCWSSIAEAGYMSHLARALADEGWAAWSLEFRRAVEAGGIANGTPGTNPTGNVLTNDTDVDAGDSKNVNGVVAGVAGSASGNVGTNVTGTYGVIHIDANGNYTYTVDNSNGAVEALRSASETLDDVFTYTTIDAGGATSTTQITVTIEGRNDEPVITIEVGDSAAASLTESDTTLTTSGTLTVTDLDLTDVVSSAVSGVVASGTTTGLSSNNAALLAMLTSTANVLDSSEQTDTADLELRFGQRSV